VNRKTVVRNAALLPALLLLVGVLASPAHAAIQITGVLSTGSHVVVIDSLDVMDQGGGFAHYLTYGVWGGDTMEVDTFVCTPPLQDPPLMVAMIWGSLDASPFTFSVPAFVPDSWFVIPSDPQEAMVKFDTGYVTGVAEQVRPGFARAGLTANPSIVRTGTTVRAEHVAGTNCAFVFFDAAGNRVRTLRTQTLAGTASATWTGEDDFGRRLPEGIYYCALDGAANPSVRKLILSH
jgi:hypothetical protein